MSVLRKELGDFNSIVCFKAAITGMEEALGEKRVRATAELLLLRADGISIGALADSGRLGSDAATRFLRSVARRIDDVVAAAPPSSPADPLPAHTLE